MTNLRLLTAAAAVCFAAQTTGTSAGQISSPASTQSQIAPSHSEHKRHRARTGIPKQFRGKASYYWQGQRVASGGRFDPRGHTAAHRTLPFGTRVRVTDPRSSRSVVVTINDRGPFTGGRVLDLSLGAAQVLGMTKRGVIEVLAEIM